MKIKLLLFTSFFFVAIGLNAQSVDQQVINSSGTHFNNTNQVTVSVGEVVVGHSSSANGQINSGFIQPFTIEVEVVNGIWDEFLAQIEVFPNPTTNYINIKIPTSDLNSTGIQGAIYNETGKIVKDFILNPSNLTFQVGFEDLPGGVYILKLESESKIKNYRIIKY